MSTQQQEFICELAMPDLSRYRQAIPAVLPSLPLKHKNQLPPVPAVYFALGEDNEVLYIGRSGSLSARWLKHHRLPELQSLGNVRLAWIEFETEEFLEEAERVLIDHFSPKLNRQVIVNPLAESAVMHLTAHPELQDAVEDFRFKHRFDRRSDTIKWLLNWALKQDPTPDHAAQDKPPRSPAKKRSKKEQ